MKKKNTSGNGDGLSYEEEQLPYSDAGENEDEQEYYDDSITMTSITMTTMTSQSEKKEKV